MEATISKESMWNIVRVFLSSGRDNREWLLNKIKNEPAAHEIKPQLRFPHIPEDFKVSEEVLGLGANLPADFDYDKVKDEMWSHFAK